MTLMSNFQLKLITQIEKNSNPDLVEKLDVENKVDLEYRILWIYR